jgi:hypothetical protein
MRKELKNMGLLLFALVLVIFTGCSSGSNIEDDLEKLYIGMAYQGGIIAYILQSGDPGYVASEQRGLIAAAEDQSAGIIWATVAYQTTSVAGGTETALGTGSANTDKIISQNGAGSTYAAGIARAYDGGDYDDWYLPSADELQKLYESKDIIGGFSEDLYWSSSEAGANWARNRSFHPGGTAGDYIKSDASHWVRAVRSF